MRIFKCDNGFEYKCPDTACVFCDHCTEILFDYTHGPYLLCCELPEHDTHNGAGCENFIEGVIRQVKEIPIHECDCCKHMENKITEEPCYSCIHGGCNEMIKKTDKWEPRYEMS